MPSFQDEILKQFGQGVTDIEGERTRQKREPLAAPEIKPSKTDPSDWLSESFTTGVEEIERARSERIPTTAAAERAEMFSIERPKRAPEGEKELTFREKWKEIKEEGPTQFVGFVSGGIEAVKAAKIAKKAWKLDRGEATEEERGELLEFAKEQRAKQYTTPGYKILDVVSAMPAFMQEFILTGPAYKVGQKAAMKGITRGLEKYTGKIGAQILEKQVGKVGMKVAAGVAGATLQTPFMGAPRIVSGTIERSMPRLRLSETERGDLEVLIAGKGEDFVPAFLKSVGDQWAETVSEHSGGLFAIMGRGAKNAAIKSGLLSSFIKANPNKSPNAVIGTFRKMGYHGVLNEMMEERLGEVLRAGIGVQDYSLPTLEQLGVEMVAFAVPGVVQSMGARAFDKVKAPDKVKKSVLGGITSTYDKDKSSEKFVSSVMEGYKGQLLDDADIDKLSKQYPELKEDLATAKGYARKEIVKDGLSAAIDEGLSTGEFQGEEFTPEDAMDFIGNGLANDIFTTEDLEGFKEKHPELKTELNSLMADSVAADMGLDDIIEEPTLLAVPERESAELERVYEKAKRRSEKRQILEEKKKAKEVPKEVVPKVELSAGKIPWTTKERAERALKHGKRFKALGFTSETHEIVSIEGGFGIAKKTEVKPEVPKVEKKEPAELEEGETLTGRDEKYGIDVELKKDEKGYTLNESDENIPEYKFTITMAGINKRGVDSSGKKTNFILNSEGDFIPAEQIKQIGSGDSSVVPYKPEPKDRDAVLSLVAKIEFERSQGHKEEAARLESQLSKIITGISVSEVLGKKEVKPEIEEKAPEAVIPTTGTFTEQLDAMPVGKEVKIPALPDAPSMEGTWTHFKDMDGEILWKNSRTGALRSSADMEIAREHFGIPGEAEKPKAPKKVAEGKQLHEIKLLDIHKDADVLMSEDMRDLHDHKARVKGFEKAGGSFVEGYIKKLAGVAEKTNTDLAMTAYNALTLYKDGKITEASLEAEKVLGELHKTEKESLTPDKIAEVHKQAVKDALAEGKTVSKEILEGYPDLVEKPKKEKPPKEHLYLMSATGKEYADLSISETSRQAFGFAEEDIKTIKPQKLNVKYKDDFENVIHAQEKSDLSKKEWAKTINLSEPIQLSFENGKFYIEDGHHRYYAAKILNKELRVDSVDIKDKPHKTAIKQALKSGKLTPEKYAELHEKDYGPLEEFMPEVIEKPEKVKKPKEEKKIGPIVPGAFGGSIRARKGAVEIAEAVQKTKQEAQNVAVKTLSGLSEKDLNDMDVDALDRLLADITQGPGNFRWKKEHYVERLLEKKEPKKEPWGLPKDATVTPKPIETKYRKRLKELKAEMGEEAYFEESLGALYEREPWEILNAYRKLYPEGAGVLYRAESSSGATISPSAKEPGRWQTTWFDAKGFSGDTSHATEAEAFAEAYRDGYRLPNPERGKQQMTSVEFVEGIAGLEAQRKKWAEVGKKEPWEMTLAEVHKVRDSFIPQIQKAEEKLEKLKRRPVSKDPAISIKHIEQVNAQEKFLEDLNNKKEKHLLAPASHKQAIMKAQGEGKEIPSHVLAEYDELAIKPDAIVTRALKDSVAEQAKPDKKLPDRDKWRQEPERERPKKERRRDVVLRKKIDELSPEEKEFTIAELRRMNEKQRERIVKLRDIAHRDPLTGLLNRRGLKKKTGRKKPHHVFMDLIGFKNINDTVSHEAGDTVLKAIAKGMKAVDVKNATRWGGDELVFQADSVEMGEAKAQELRDYFKENSIKVVNEKGEKYRVTVMFRHGVARTVAEADTLAEEKRAAEPKEWKRGEKHPGLEKIGAVKKIVRGVEAPDIKLSIEEKEPPVDIEGNDLVDMDGIPVDINSDGTVTLYHRTSPESKKSLERTGKFRTLENRNETFFSNKLEGQAVGYGDAVIAVKVKPSITRLDDAFHDGEISVAVSNKFLSKKNIVKAKEFQYSIKGDGPVYVRRGSLTDEVLNRMNKYLKSLGYDNRGKKDVYQALKGRTLEDGTERKGMMDSETREISHPDWANAYERAMKGIEVRKKKLKIKKEKKVSAINVNWDRIKELGKTGDIREAGYITPEGGLVDLSGKREGGTPGMRSYDHREAGGSLGMQEFMALGNIRMDFRAGTLDILEEPTPAQYKKIDELVREHKGELVVDLGEGLGEQGDTYYLNPDRTFGSEYQRGATLSEIRNDIEKFYAGEDVKPATRPVLFSEEPAKEPAKKDILLAERGGLADARHTVESLKTELSERIGKDALEALDRGKKVRLITSDEAVELTGRPDLRESGVQGFYSNGIVYLLPENIDKGHGFNVLMHELGVHHGYQKIFGERLAKEVFAAFVANKGKDTPLGRAVDVAIERVERRTRPGFRNEEAVAYFCEENANTDLALHRKIITRMRLWAVKYFGVKPDIFTHDDYVALAASAMRGEAKKALRTPEREGVSREVFYSKEADSAVTGDPGIDNLFFEPATDVNIKKMAKYLRDNKDKTIRLYHGTDARIDILNQGLKPTSAKTAKSLQAARGFVAMSAYPGMAETFGEMAYPQKNIKVYAVDVPISELKADFDQLRNKRLFAGEKVGNTLAESLLVGHGARVKGWVQPNMITEYEAPTEDARYSVKEKEEISKFSVSEMPVEEAAKKVTDNPNFVKWFGDSKAVDEKGKPLITYHGTADEITIFEEGERGRTTAAESAKKGFFFTPNKEVAESYSEFARPKEIDRLKFEYERLEKIAQKTGTNKAWDAYSRAYEKYENAELSYVGEGKGNIVESYLSIQNPLIHDYEGDEYRDESYSELIDKAIKNKNDGVILKNTYDGAGEAGTRTNPLIDVYVVFESTQIKSIFNIGTFDPMKADIRYSAKEKKDLHAWADNLIKSAKEDGKILVGIEAAKGPVTADDYTSNRETNKKVKLAAVSNIKKVATEIVEGVDKYLGSISTRLGQISPKLKDKLRRLDFDINTKYAKDVKLVEPLLIKAKKMSKEDFADWDYARKNSDVAKINELVSKYGMQKEYKVYREALARLRMEGIDVGMDIGEIEEYAPRILKDTSGFLTAIGKDPEWPLYSRLLQERANELGISVAEMPTDIKADIISNTILGGWSGLSGVPATKQRKLKKIPPKLNPFYLDSDAALMQHLHSMRNGIEARKFFGKIPKKVAKMRTRLSAAQSKIREMNEQLKAELTEEETAKLERRRNKYIGLERAYTDYVAKYATQRDYTQNIGSYVMELIESKEISPHQEQTVNEILMARFHEAGTRGLVQDYKNLSYIDTMGSPISALTQIADLVWAAYEGRLVRLMGYAGKATIGKARITRKDVGVERIAQEFADSGMLGNAVTKVFKIVGLEKIDAIGKESLMAAALDKYQKQARKNPEELKKKIRSMFEGETDSVVEDLLVNEISDNVKLLVYCRLLDFQPVGLSEMPQKYLDAGNGRLFYMLKTFTLKVFDVFRNESYYKIKNGNRAEKIQGIKNLAMLSFLFVLCNAGVDELKDWVLGRKTEFSDRMVDNLLRLVGVSKFVTWKARTEGVGSALARQVLPPFKFIDSLGKDIITAGDEKGLEVLGSVPVVGKLAYWHIGRGAGKREDLWEGRLRKRKAKLSKIEESFGKAKDKKAYRKEHWKELKEFQAVKSLQSSLNKGRIKVNKLKSKEETPERKRAIQRLEKERTEQIRDFLKSTDRTERVVDSIWSGVLGTTAEMDTTQTEINRLVESGALIQSGKPSRNINAGHGIEVKLDDDQYSRYVADTSAMIRLAMARLVARSAWQKWSDKKRAFAVKRVINKGRKIVRDRLKKTILKARLKARLKRR